MSTATKDDAGWKVPITIAASGEKTVKFETKNHFVDDDVRVVITTPAASSPTLSANNITDSLSMGSASSGVYSPTATITGNAVISTAGWIASGNHNVFDTNVIVGKVNQSTMANGNTTIASGDTITPTDSSQTITISEGYNAARTLIVGAASTGAAGEITSGSASISSLTYSYDSTNGNFTVSGSADVSAPTVNTAGYISSTVGTKNANSGGATVDTTINKIAIAANLSGTGTKKPSIAKVAATNIDAAGTATTTQPSTGYYIAVASAANTGTVQATASVTSAGYGTATSGTYTTTPSSSLTIGAAASDTTYIPLTQATFENSATSGVEYTDISSTGPVLISGSYLFINEGYTPATKISLARLVPDASGTNASAAYILENYTAFDNDGTLIIGTMQTYNGSYTVV